MWLNFYEGHREGKDLRLNNQKKIDSINKTWLNFYKGQGEGKDLKSLYFV